MNPIRPDLRERLLREYSEAAAPQPERLFHRLAAGNLIGILALGALLVTVDVTPAARIAVVEARPVRFRVAEAPIAPPSPPKPPEARREEPSEPPQLRPETRLDQAIDLPAAEPSDADPTPAPRTIRRVYGMRKVLASGLGTGSSDGDGLVVKRGNTLDGHADTLEATDDDLRAPVVSLSTVETAPVPVYQARPRYSPTLIENHASGVVSARLLVDTDGSVRRLEIVEDIGFDSREIATEALRQFRFRPALRDGQPVAVWILYKIRFEFQD